MMAEDVQQKVFEEDLESEEGDLESYLEEESSSELLERVRELEAENSALSLANESQREAYERCLDEVANHVVQALLNQKDLREECIKLKMRVFDLERQNRTLCELLQEKLHNQSCSHLQPGPCLGPAEHPCNDPNKLLETQRNAQTKGNGECAQSCLPETQGCASSMEALSPFLKKKAHILEVLRKLEETDPLRYHCSHGISSLCDYSQALVSKEVVLACRDSPSWPNAAKTHCSQSCADANAHQHMNGGELNGLKSNGNCTTCLILSNKDPTGLAKSGHSCCTPNPNTIANFNLAQPDNQDSSELQSLTKPTAGTNEHLINRRSVEVSTEKDHRKDLASDLQPVTDGDHNRIPECAQTDSQLHKENDVNVKEKTTDCELGGTDCNDKFGAEHLQDTANVINLKKDLNHLNLENIIGDEEHLLKEGSDGTEKLSSTTSKLPTLGLKEDLQISYSESQSIDITPKGLLFSPNENHTASKVLDEISVPRKDTLQDPLPERAKLAVSPSNISCLNEVKASPSKLLKFLKIPTLGDRAQVANPLRLSPQLTRSSKIPCRSNNYEVHHSPVAIRKATTTERQRQPPTSKPESYPSTHSAPTSPPQPEDQLLPTVKELSCSTAKANAGAKPSQTSDVVKNPQKLPHYENISDLSASGDAEVPRLTGEASKSLCYTGGSKVEIKEKQSNPTLLRSSNPKHKVTTPVSESSGQDGKPDSHVWLQHVNQCNVAHQSSPYKAPPNGTGLRSRSQDKDELEKRTTLQRKESDEVIKRNDPPPIPKKTGIGRPPGESSHSFKERLAALGKLRNPEDSSIGPQPSPKTETQSTTSVVTRTSEKDKTADRLSDCNPGDHRHSKNSDCSDGSSIAKHLSSAQPQIQEVKSLPSCTVISKPEVESPKTKIISPPTSLEAPQASRSHFKPATPQSLAYSSKNASSPMSSPNKLPLRSPTKTVQPPSSRDGKPSQEFQRYLSKSEDRSQLRASKKKNASFGESLPPPPRQAEAAEEKRHSAPGPQTSIEQKVMKGIEENMLKLQEQDKGQVAEVKQKTSSGIANWFGLRKSKLPALSRKPELSKVKDEKKEWKLNISSASKDVKSVAKGKPEGESLNISMLMEKAEGLHKALEEERAYVNGVAMDRQGKGHSCEVVMDQSQGHLSVMYRGVPSDNFMQQLLYRVDGKDNGHVSVARRRLSFDCKSRPMFSHQNNSLVTQTCSNVDIGKSSSLSKDEVTHDDNLSEPIHHQHFTGSAASTHTLDSGIGTFPLPDNSANVGSKSIPKVKAEGDHDSSASKGKHGTKLPQKAWTLERELSSLEEGYIWGQDIRSPDLQSTDLESKAPSSQITSLVHEDDTYGARVKTVPTKTWTFPNPKAPTEPAAVYLGSREVMEPVSHRSSFRRLNKAADSSTAHEGDLRSLPYPPQAMRPRVRTPANAELGAEPGRGGPEDALSPSHPQALETPESLSDSLYDSFSSCGSQG